MNVIQICIIAGAIFGALPILACFLQALINYWTRGDGDKLVHLAFSINSLGLYDSEDEIDPELIYPVYILAAVTIYGFLGCGLGHVIENGYLWHALISVGCLIAIIILPRLFLDAGKALKYNRKTGNAERIDKLEAELAELRRK